MMYSICDANTPTLGNPLNTVAQCMRSSLIVLTIQCVYTGGTKLAKTIDYTCVIGFACDLQSACN